MFEREADATASKVGSEYHAIQYQDYVVKKKDRVSQTRAAAFPKILILEQIGE